MTRQLAAAAASAYSCTISVVTLISFSCAPFSCAIILECGIDMDICVASDEIVVSGLAIPRPVVRSPIVNSSPSYPARSRCS